MLVIIMSLSHRTEPNRTEPNRTGVSAGSDAPIESCCPFTGMHDAILRRARPEPPSDDVLRMDTGTDCGESLSHSHHVSVIW